MTDLRAAASGTNPSVAYYRKDMMDLDAWFRVTQVDYERLIEQLSPRELFGDTPSGAYRLLDLGCGTARFPALLDRTIADDLHVAADLLDISDYCLNAAVAQYRALHHFSPAMTYLSAIEDLGRSVDRSRRFDVIWAIHSLCTVAQDRIAEVCRFCWDALKPNGTFLIYQLARNSSYYRLYDYYLTHYPAPNSATRMLASEDHQEILSSLGIGYEVRRIRFTHRIAQDERQLLEVYLRKCVMDHDAEVLEFFRPVLDEQATPEQAQYRFDQEVDLLMIHKPGDDGPAAA